MRISFFSVKISWHCELLIPQIFHPQPPSRAFQIFTRKGERRFSYFHVAGSRKTLQEEENERRYEISIWNPHSHSPSLEYHPSRVLIHPPFSNIRNDEEKTTTKNHSKTFFIAFSFARTLQVGEEPGEVEIDKFILIRVLGGGRMWNVRIKMI